MERPHKRLIVWQKSIDLTERVYRLSDKFPSEERFGLASQMRRAAASVPTNIAEGAARSTDKDKVHFYIIARGSLSELDTQREIIKRLGYGTDEDIAGLDGAIS